MTTIKTEQHTPHYLTHAEANGLVFDLPAALELRSRIDKLSGQRLYYVQAASESWHFPNGLNDCKAVLAWLERNGFAAKGDLPPDCFLFAKAGA